MRRLKRSLIGCNPFLDNVENKVAQQLASAFVDLATKLAPLLFDKLLELRAAHLAAFTAKAII